MILLISSLALAQRVCLSPDSLVVDNSSARSLSSFIYVPPSTTSYTIGVFDQADDQGTVGQPSSFILYAPNGQVAQRLEAPQQRDWADYEINVAGRWGIWRLDITGPQPPPQQRQTVRNHFLLRTVGDVDLYIKLEPRARVWFSPPRFGASPLHSFTIIVPPLNRLRLNLLRPQDGDAVKVQLEAPKGVSFAEKWGGLGRGDREFLEIRGRDLQGVWKLTVSDLKGEYALGIEQELRLFFTDSPLMKPKDVLLKTVAEDGKTPLPARANITSPQTGLETYITYTDREGFHYLSLLPDILYTITVSRGFEYEPYSITTTADLTAISAPLRRILYRPKGWYCGDTHMHTIYSDGNDTPRQMVEAGQGEGLDWVVLSDHGAGPNIPNVLLSQQEGMELSQPGKFVVIPGEEFSTVYHANIINGTVSEPASVSLSQLVRTVRRENTPLHPLAIKLNHPYWDGTPKAPEIARETPLLPLLENWNCDPQDEPSSAYLFWELLNRGWRIFGDTATDTHSRKAAKVGTPRTYVYLADLPLTADNVTRALLAGHSFLSNGALLFFSIEGKIPGEKVLLGEGTEVRIKIEAESMSPLDRVELVNNGKVLHSIPVGGVKRFSADLKLPLAEGWIIAQAMEKDTPFPLAMSNPIFLRRQ